MPLAQNSLPNWLPLIDKSIHSSNLYRMAYHSNIVYQDRKTAKKDYVTLANKLYPEQMNEINKFEKQYDLSLKGK